MAFTEHQQVAGHNLLERHGHDVAVARDVGNGFGRTGQPVERRAGAGLEHHIDAQHRDERNCEHNGIARLAEKEVDRGGNGEHHRHGIGDEPNKLPDARQPIPLHPAIRSDVRQSAARLDARQPFQSSRDFG